MIFYLNNVYLVSLSVAVYHFRKPMILTSLNLTLHSSLDTRPGPVTNFGINRALTNTTQKALISSYTLWPMWLILGGGAPVHNKQPYEKPKLAI